MRPLWQVLLVAAGRGRALLVIGSTAVATGLLLVAVSITRLGFDSSYESYNSDPDTVGLTTVVAEPGTRGGVALAAALLVVPVLLLLDQAVRLGSSDRERRYTALAVAGATRADRRRWGAVEVGVPAAVGAVAGIGVWLVLRLLLGTALQGSGRALVPTAVGPGWWTPLVVGVIVGAAVLVGVRQGSREAAVLPDAASLRRPPRPWGLLPVAAAIALVVLLPFGDSELWFFLAVVLVLVGLVVLSPWLAHAVAGRVAGRADSAETLLAVRRLRADPGPAGRAAAAVGGVSLAGGVLGVFVADILLSSDVSDIGYYLGGAGLVGLCLLLAVAVVSGTLAVHSTETVLQRRRQMAALVATGVPASVISRSQRVEGLLATVPLAVLGSLVGSLGYSAVGFGLLGLLVSLVSVALTVGVVALGAVVSTALMRPWVRDAVRPLHLRSE